MLSEDGFRKAVGGYFDAIQECMDAGFNKWFKIPPEFRVIATARTRSSFIHDAIRDELVKRFSDVPGIEIMVIRNLFLVKFGEDVLMKIKKFNMSFRTQNIPTTAARLFSRQGIQESLLGVPFATKVIAGYQPDKAHAETRWTGIVCPDGKHQYHWCVDFEKRSATALPFPIVQEPSREPGVVAEPKPKGEGLKDEKTRDEDI